MVAASEPIKVVTHLIFWHVADHSGIVDEWCSMINQRCLFR